MLTIKEIIADLDRIISARENQLDKLDNDEDVYTERGNAMEELELVRCIRNDIADKLSIRKGIVK